ncbi:unnamed protein product [Rotaria sordida]|uniref:Poly [ADP-ribose] polymerase n=1 Tax=Rotaria sordida TaxID=392033 RepID=A0A813ZUG6_9BILA|nr:unnamed protein product [Rotaria sordida]CAF0971710.1 unnamed protein product [Rotaria sordida]CAF1051157.1 unnamed protein product [Rotaria sordida]
MECDNHEDYIEKICTLQYDVLLKDNQSAINEYVDFCSTRQILSIFDFNNKQLRLFGSSISTKEAEKRFFDLQNELLIENIKARKIDGILWWYETWDATWQQYNAEITADIEHHYNTNVSSVIILNELGEQVKIDFHKLEEIYGTRIKRIRRSKIDELQPIYWKLTPLNIEQFLLDSESTEYLWIKDDFDKKMKGLYTRFITIERIQNMRLFKQFSILHEEYLTKYGKIDNGTMRFLYHGCPESATRKIIERGFNRSYCGVNGCVYGRGVYFSTDSSFSNKYANPNEKKEKRMFYSRVLLGRSMIGNSTMCEPADGYDTTTNGTHIFVCYYDSQCYPEYLLTYM